MICLLLLTGVTTQVVGSTGAEDSVNNAMIDEHLWATWGLETAVITADNSSKTYTLADLLAEKNLLAGNIFLSLYFFDNQVGVTLNKTAFSPEFEQSLKGFVTTNNGELTMTMRDRQTHTFMYVIENERLKISYTQADTQYYLTYKLLTKNIR